MKSKKIILITKDTRGGIETFIRQLEKIQSKYLKFKFIFYKKDNFVNYKRNSIFLNYAYPIDYKFSWDKVYLLFDNLLKTCRLINKESPDIVIGFPNYSVIVISLIKRFLIKRLYFIAIINNNSLAIINERSGFIFRTGIRLLFTKLINIPDKLVFTSVEMAKKYQSKFDIPDQKITVINHSVDLREAYRLQQGKIPKTELKIFKNKSFKIVSVGRFEKQKDFHTILKAFRLILDNKPNTELILIGDGPDKEILNDLSKNLDVYKKVHFLKWQKNVYKYLKHCDLFILSSNYEGFAMVIVEAMAMGIPVVATNTPYGPKEILDNGKYGVLVPMKDTQKMASEILKLIKSKKLRNRYRKSGLERVKKYGTKNMLKEFKNLFDNISK